MFEGNCTAAAIPTVISGNSMRAATYGLYLRNNSETGTQGSPAAPCDNFYFGPFASNYETYADNVSTVNTNSVFYCSTGNALPTLPMSHGGAMPYVYNLGMIPVYNPSYSAGCVTCSSWLKPITGGNAKSTGIAYENPAAAEENSLHVYPNPAADNCTIAYETGSEAHISVAIYNLLGAKLTDVVNEEQQAGTHTYTISLKNKGLKAGVYFITPTAGGQTAMQRLILTD